MFYFTVVRSMLSVWVCSTKDNGASALVAEPSLSCDAVPPTLVTLRQWSIASAVLYTVGIPAVFAVILFRYRVEIREDQKLLAAGTGASPATNPHFSVRRRFNQLYESFAPGYASWRLLLILRKFAIVFVAVAWVEFPMLQASLSVAIIFVSYALQVHYRPFLEGDNSKQLDITKAVKAGATAAYFIPFNRLEAGYLVTSMVTLLAGMIFQSGSLSVSSRGYLALTVVVGTALVGFVTLFIGLITFEVFRSVAYNRRIRLLMKPARVVDSAGKAHCVNSEAWRCQKQ